jgi:tryptophan synthase beta chain
MRLPLNEGDLPEKWYNVVPDLDFTIPPLISSSGYPVGHTELEPVSSHAIVDQELEKERNEIPLPKEVREFYSNWRPTPIFRADKLEKQLETPARIFCKYEGGGVFSSHEANTAIAQTYYASIDNVKRLITATANGEWGVSLSIACNYFGVACTSIYGQIQLRREGQRPLYDGNPRCRSQTQSK